MHAPFESAGGRKAISGPLLTAVFLFHYLVGFLLYRGRVVSHWLICDSDLIVLAAPFVFAVTGYAYVLFASPWLRPRSARRRVILLAVCLALVFLSTWCYNVCGTEQLWQLSDSPPLTPNYEDHGIKRRQAVPVGARSLLVLL